MRHFLRAASVRLCSQLAGHPCTSLAPLCRSLIAVSRVSQTSDHSKPINQLHPRRASAEASRLPCSRVELVWQLCQFLFPKMCSSPHSKTVVHILLYSDGCFIQKRDFQLCKPNWCNTCCPFCLAGYDRDVYHPLKPAKNTFMTEMIIWHNIREIVTVSPSRRQRTFSHTTSSSRNDGHPCDLLSATKSWNVLPFGAMNKGLPVLES